jgi:hypothetical protein
MRRNLLLMFVFVRTVEFQVHRRIHRWGSLEQMGEAMKRRNLHALNEEEEECDLEEDAEVFLAQTRKCQAELGNSP